MDKSGLYQELILDHSRNPRNYGKLQCANCESCQYNPTCGDELKMYVFEEDGIIKDVKFEGKGCAISIASASLMSDIVIGKSKKEAWEAFDDFYKMLTSKSKCGDCKKKLGKLSALEGVGNYPARIKCATLCWNALKDALKEEG